MINALQTWFDRFWFAPTSAAGLAVMRIASGGYAFYYLFTRYSMMNRIASSDDALFEPVGLARLLEAPLAVTTFEALLCLTLIANLAFVCGLAYRVSGPLFAGLLLARLESHGTLTLGIAVLCAIVVYGRRDDVKPTSAT